MSGKPEHSHYHKDVQGLTHVDVYRVLLLFGVTDPCLQHAIKKLLVAGGRGAGKDIKKDVQEAIDSCERWLEMRQEEVVALSHSPVVVYPKPDPLAPDFPGFRSP